MITATITTTKEAAFGLDNHGLASMIEWFDEHGAAVVDIGINHQHKRLEALVTVGGCPVDEDDAAEIVASKLGWERDYQILIHSTRTQFISRVEHELARLEHYFEDR